MRDLATVCLRCRTRLLLLSSSTRPARQGIARYSTSAQYTVPDLEDPGELGTPTHPTSRNHGRKRRPPAAGARIKDGLSSLEIFLDVVKEQGNKTEAPTKAATGMPENLVLLQDIATLQSMLQDRANHTTSASFDFFESKISPSINKPGVEVPKTFRDRVGRGLLERISREKANDMESKDLPTVTRISQLSLDLGLLQPHAWARLTLKLLEYVCSVSTSPNDHPSIESYEATMARREDLLHDLLGAWKVLNVQRFTALRVGSAAKAAHQIGPPSFTDAMKIQLSSKKVARNPLGVLFPHYDPGKLNEVTSAAIGTYVLLTDPIYNKRAVRQEATPFLNAIARILTIVRPDQQQLPALFTGRPNISKYVEARWPTVENEIPEMSRTPAFHAHPVKGVDIHKLVGEAWNTGNLQAVQNAFKEFYGHAPQDPAKKAELLRNAELFNYFIMAFMGMRQPKLAIEVWNAMGPIGLEPTLKTWTAMMDGCLRARNPQWFKSVWDRLIQSGTKLDTAIWTARVSGLIALGEPDEGLAALVTMAKLWQERSRSGKENIAVQPTIQPVNAAIAGLLRLGRAEDAQNVLAWAAKQGIEPDIYTFNTLLRSRVTQGRTDEIRQILTMMKAQHIEADVVTFTIIMEQMLRGIGQHEPEKQVEIVTELLREMEAYGAKANMMAYAKMIHILLEEGDNAAESVKVVMGHIWSNGLELTSHIYTMLVEHYFSRDPPDVAAVTALIENRRLHDNKNVDRVFWERVIKGYCQVGDTACALAIFEKINKPGLVITFATRHELLLALIKAGELEAAETLVQESKKLREAPEFEGGDENLRFWKHRFWHLAKDSGFLKTELLTRSAKATGLGS
ncbi:hypothetical protein GQ53DRAFT_744350 [Thozetella sp. PMI_491]|nr:hypothetical protein GQ53DRAFT_744350 [Thozetella sp. PMI_491]